MQLEKLEKLENPGRVLHTCPCCQTKVLFEPIAPDLRLSSKYVCGQRVCPNCRTHVFTVFEWDKLSRAYPPLRIDFDSSAIPERIVKVLSEALDCHRHNYNISAAIMVRRTLEELCAERGAQGKDLKARIRDLRGKVILPTELFDAMDELRLLGNDAAHIEAKSYEEIGPEELQEAIEFTKEILKGVYQNKGLLSKLQALKKKSAEQVAAPNAAEPRR
jgi:hypothetical protein